MEKNVEQFLWVEKWRPTKIKDCILTDEIKEMAEGFIKQGRLPNLLFAGGAGTGKTTLAKAMCNEVGADYIIINASGGAGIAGIDQLRVKITQFASTVSFSDSKKVVILDEADYLSANVVQPALRNFMEEYSANCSFILTCNFKNRIIEPLHSRCSVVDFKISNADKPKLASQFFKRVTSILDDEKIDFDKKVVAEVVQKHFPDFRRVLNELQSYAATGKIDSGILINMSEESYSVLFKALKDRKFGDMRKWVAENADNDSAVVFQAIYEKATEKLEPKSIPSVILLIAQYQYQAAFVANQEINTVACLTEIMMNGDVVWK